MDELLARFNAGNDGSLFTGTTPLPEGGPDMSGLFGDPDGSPGVAAGGAGGAGNFYPLHVSLVSIFASAPLPSGGHLRWQVPPQSVPHCPTPIHSKGEHKRTTQTTKEQPTRSTLSPPAASATSTLKQEFYKP